LTDLPNRSEFASTARAAVTCMTLLLFQFVDCVTVSVDCGSHSDASQIIIQKQLKVRLTGDTILVL
jgi:hypothetical protein